MVQVAEISWTEARDLFKKTDVAILPVGSTEEHGPPNPLGTDFLVPEKLSRIIGEKTGVPVLPVIPVGIAEKHRHFAGTLWVPPSVLRDYVRAVLLSVASHGIKKIMILNGHGPNNPPLLEIAREFRRHHNIFLCVMSASPPSEEGARARGEGHASSGETSINLYFFKHLVNMEKAVDTKQGTKLGPFEMEEEERIKVGKSRISALFANETIDLTETGVMGDAGVNVIVTTANEERGRALMEPFIEEICAFVEILKKADVNDLLCKPLK